MAFPPVAPLQGFFETTELKPQGVALGYFV
jgi:hypothetical protein